MDQVQTQIAWQLFDAFSYAFSEKNLSGLVNSVINSEDLVKSALDHLMPKIGEGFKFSVAECINNEMNIFEQIKKRNLSEVIENQKQHVDFLDRIGDVLLSISLTIGFSKLDEGDKLKNAEKPANKVQAKEDVLPQDYEAVISKALKSKDQEVIKKKLKELNLEEIMETSLSENTYYDLADELINLVKEGDWNSTLWLEKICRIIPITQNKRKKDFFKKILFSNDEGFGKYQEILFQRL